MNHDSLKDFEKEQEELLKKYELDSKSIQEFRKQITILTEQESLALGEQLYQLISKKGYRDSTNIDEAIKLILEGADLEFKEKNKGDFSLLICARKNYLKTYLSLLRAGANVNQRNHYLTTSMMAAARHGNFEILEASYLMGGDVNLRCSDGETAIVSAKRHNQKKCFQFLADRNAFLNIRNLDGESLLDIPGNVSFDFSLVKDFSVSSQGQETILNPSDLIQEAQEKFNEKVKRLELSIKPQ